MAISDHDLQTAFALATSNNSGMMTSGMDDLSSMAKEDWRKSLRYWHSLPKNLGRGKAAEQNHTAQSTIALSVLQEHGNDLDVKTITDITRGYYSHSVSAGHDAWMDDAVDDTFKNMKRNKKDRMLKHIKADDHSQYPLEDKRLIMKLENTLKKAALPVLQKHGNKLNIKTITNIAREYYSNGSLTGPNRAMEAALDTVIADMPRAKQRRMMNRIKADQTSKYVTENKILVTKLETSLTQEKKRPSVKAPGAHG